MTDHPTAGQSADHRTAQIRANLARLRERVATACERAGRRAEDVSIIAVTKTWPASDVRILAGLGVTDVGENRDQEAGPKHAECADLDLTWHFVGQLQTNKARSVAGYAHVVHSVDRARLAHELGRRARHAGHNLRCLVQVNLDPASVRGELGPRGGADPGDLLPLAEVIDTEDGLQVGGLMAVAPPGSDPAAAFRRLNTLASALRARYPHATMVSAGMSGDLEAAVECGATHLRIGAALLGDRAMLVG